MRVLMTGGGTAGHVNPALAIANTIMENDPSSEIAFVGTSRGIENKLVAKAGYELLEITTPGTRDMESVLRNRDKIEDGNFFIKYLLKTADKSTLADFQQFLQKSGLSSFVQVIARVRR